jgi:Family of unknown function (DUF6174)/Domain of unknown function (DUF6438)
MRKLLAQPIFISLGLLLSLGFIAPASSQSPTPPALPTNLPSLPQINQNIPNQRRSIITLERTACFGACPIYKLTIFGDGKVVYEGERFVKITGKRTAKISQKAVKELISDFEKINYFSLQNSYQGGPTDLPSAITSFNTGRKQKTVSHYLGSPNAPKELTELENKIDTVVNSQQWIAGTGTKTSELETNQKLWNQQNFSSYRYTLSRSCFCTAEAREPVVIQVKEGKVTGITSVKTGKPVNRELFQAYDSVPKLFAVIKDAIAKKAASLDVKYHPTLGYPIQINVDYNAQIADEELYLTVDKLEAVK